MKAIVIGIAIMTSFTANAKIGEFERGYLAGKQAIPDPALNAVICTVPELRHFNKHSATGRTREEAILNFEPRAIQNAEEEDKNIVCRNI